MSGKIVASFVTALALIGATLTAARSQAPPRPLPIMTPDAAATVISANFAAFDLGTRYLYNSSGQGGLADLAHMFGAPNPNGGGAPNSPSDPRYRTWAEGYALAITQRRRCKYPRRQTSQRWRRGRLWNAGLARHHA